MQSLNIAKKLLPGILFLLLAVFSPLPRCAAVTIEAIYDDDDGEGFKDETPLAPTLKEFLATRGNDADTLGEARKNAFEYTASLLESRLTNTNTIRIGMEFVIFQGQAKPDNLNQCSLTSDVITVARAKPTGHGFLPGRWEEGDPQAPDPQDRIGFGTGHPYALAEAIHRREYNDQNADLEISFSKCVPFYYGFTGTAPAREIDFVRIALHEILHGLGFLEWVRGDGNLPVGMVEIERTVNGITTTRQASIKAQTVYDEQLYSETDDKPLAELSNSERAAAITSETGLLWEGTDGGRNDCSYGQRMAELKSDSAKAHDGKPRLYAPSTYNFGGSIAHVHRNAGDIMEPLFPFPRNMDLALGMLKDMGWEVSDDGFPPGCEPTGITVTPTSELVTTEGGGEATFEVKLESKPLEDVIIPVTSSNPWEGVLDPQILELTFTPSDWDTPQEVTVRGVDDNSHDGTQDYFIILEKTDSKDRFYDGLAPQIVSLRNIDDETLPELSIEDVDAVEEAGSMNFTVRLSPQSVQTVTVRYTTTDGTAQEGSDYIAIPANSTLTFTPGETQKTIRVSLIDDNINEPDEETFTVILSNPQNAVLAQNRSTATGIIKDNDPVQPPPPPPVVAVSFGLSSYSVTEGETVDVQVTLSADPERTVTIPLTIDQTTTAGTGDYSLSQTSVTFASGETSKNITLTATDDDIDDDGEVVVLAFGTLPQRVSGGTQTSATVTIGDNDDPNVSVQFASSVYSVTEGKTVDVQATLSADPERTVMIPLTIDQTTTAGTGDYSLSQTSVTFASGETSKDITLTATDDDVDDDNEVVVLAFGTLPQRVSGGTQASATVTIRDINSPPLGVEAGENRTVAQREEVILKGSAINAMFGEPTYRWTYTGARNDIELRNPDSATCAFTAPDGLSENVVLVFRLVVEDSRGASAEDTVSITVTSQKIAFSSKNAGGTVTLGDGSTVEVTVNRDAGSPPGNPVIILSPDLVEDIDEITFHISADLPEAPPSGLRLEGFVADIDLGVPLGEGETVTVCLPAPQSAQKPTLYHYDEESGAWEHLESRLETVDGVRSVCAETGVFSVFGVFVAERSEPPVNTTPSGGTTEESGGSGCAITAEVDHGTESAAVNLLLFITVLFSVFFRKSRLIT